VGIAVLMVLTTFSLMMIVLVMAFIPKNDLRRFLKWIGGRASGWRLLFNRHSERQINYASAIHAVDVWDQVAIGEGLENRLSRSASPLPVEVDQLTLQTADGQRLTGFAVSRCLTRTLRLLWPLAPLTWIPGANSLSRWLTPVARPTTLAGPHEPLAPRASKAVEGVKSKTVGNGV
jgi:hypothetical protein